MSFLLLQDVELEDRMGILSLWAVLDDVHRRVLLRPQQRFGSEVCCLLPAGLVSF